MKYNFLLIIFISFFGIVDSFGQNSVDQEEYQQMEIDGQAVNVFITGQDTFVVADLEGFNVSIPRSFDNDAEHKRYKKYRRYAQKVYPYAVKAIVIFKENEALTQELNKRKKRKHMRRLQKRMEEEFEDPLKKLSKTQGKILVKMIERELNTPFYYLIKDLRGTFTAGKWNTLSRFWGYKLKEGYIPGDDKILDAVLYDYDVSHDLPATNINSDQSSN